ncbi:CoA-dependent acyltransferase, partial [Anaeromyces robustus]
MIPNFYKEMNEIPLTNHGKLNRKALPEPEFNLKDLIKEPYVAPQSEVEKTLCVLYSKIFNIPIENIGIKSVFHELGGDSLIAIKILTQVNKIFNIKLGVKDILENATIYSLANCIEQKIINNNNNNKDNNQINQMGCVQRYNKDEFPITSLLSSFPYKIDNKLILAFSFNMLVFYQLNKATNIEKLIKAINIVLERHEILKTRFMINQENKIVGKTIKDEKLEIEYYTKDNFEKFVRPFNLTKDKLLIRVGLIQGTEDEDVILMMDMDHRIGDGISYGILIKELLMAYSDIPLPELPIQYSDYAIDYDKRVHSIERSDIIKFYKDEIFNEPYASQLTLPKKENFEIKCKAIESYFVRTNEETYRTINQITEKYKLSKTALFLTVYSFVISMYSDDDENKNIFTTVLVSNRMMPDTEKLIGLFLRCIPLLIKIKKGVTLLDLIKECMNIILKAYDCDIPYTMISEAINLPVCNSVIQFDPYDLKRSQNQNQNQNQNLPKLISLLEMFKKYGKESVLFQLLNSNNILHPDSKWTIGEEKDYYSILFKYNKNLYSDSLIKEIVNRFIYILSDENNF